MRKDIFVLFGKDTLKTIDVSYGGPYRSKWNLEQHPGPEVRPCYLLGQQGTGPFYYLYPEHLELLYERFRRDNPSGVELMDDNEIDLRYAKGLDPETYDRLLDERKIFVGLDSTDEELGYPHLRPYLPEIFEPEMVRRMEADPWLDAWLLQAAIAKGQVPDRRDYHPRWSPEWRAYCEREMERRRAG